jgi:hypothetical protein
VRVSLAVLAFCSLMSSVVAIASFHEARRAEDAEAVFEQSKAGAALRMARTFGGAALAFGLVAAFVFARRARAEARSDRGRRRIEPGLERRPQIAGEPCVCCSRSIVTEREGTFCEACARPVHAALCHARHAARAHAHGPPIPYRY